MRMTRERKLIHQARTFLKCFWNRSDPLVRSLIPDQVKCDVLQSFLWDTIGFKSRKMVWLHPLRNSRVTPFPLVFGVFLALNLFEPGFRNMQRWVMFPNFACLCLVCVPGEHKDLNWTWRLKIFWMCLHFASSSLAQ